MKIIKHCSESLPNLVTGQLLGLDVRGSLEVTNCFPFPITKDDDDDERGSFLPLFALLMLTIRSMRLLQPPKPALNISST